MWAKSDFRENPKYYGDVFPAPGYRAPFAVSSKYSAFCPSPDVIGFLPVDFRTHIETKAATGRKAEYGSQVFTVPSIPKCMSGKARRPNVNSLEFSPFDDTLLMAGLDSGLVQLWKLPDHYSALGDVDKTHFTFDSLSDQINVVKFHPTASDIGVVGGKNSLFVLDLSTNRVVSTFSNIFDGGDVISIDFNNDGTLIRGVTKQGLVFALDPRSSYENCSEIELGRLKSTPAKILHLTHLSPATDEVILIASETSFKEPRIQIFDLKGGPANVDWANALYKKDYDHRSCIGLVAYDRYSTITYISFKQTSDIFAFESYPSAGGKFEMNKVSQFHSVSTLGMSFDLMPKRGIKTREINRVIRLGKDRIDQITHHKGGKVIYSNLVKSADICAPLKGSQWLDGQNAARQVTATLVASDFKEKEVRKTSLFLHTEGESPNELQKQYTFLTPGTVSIPLGLQIKSNGKFCAFPAKVGGGGALAVIDYSVFGRQKQKEIRCHKEKITCFDLSQIDECNLIATGANDCKVFVWRVKDNLKDVKTHSEAFEQLKSLQHSGKVTSVKFHPCASNILITASRSLSGTEIRVYDLSASEDDPSVTIKDITDDGAAIMDMEFDTTGHLCAISSKDKKIRIVNLISQKVVLEFENINEGMRDTKLFWVGPDDSQLLTLGFGTKSIRRMSLWDLSGIRESEDGDDASADDEKREDAGAAASSSGGGAPQMVAEQVISVDNAIPIGHYDRDNGLFYYTAVGDRRIRVFEIKNDSISEMMGGYHGKLDVLGLTVLPKKYVDVKAVQQARMLLLSRGQMTPVNFSVPRKRKEYFQNDLYSLTIDTEVAAYSASDYLAGNAVPSNQESIASVRTLISLKPDGMVDLSDAPEEKDSIHQTRRKSALKKMANEKLKEAPRSTEAAMDAFSRMTEGVAAGANRWDAVPIKSEVADDEWDDSDD